MSKVKLRGFLRPSVESPHPRLLFIVLTVPSVVWPVTIRLIVSVMPPPVGLVTRSDNGQCTLGTTLLLGLRSAGLDILENIFHSISTMDRDEIVSLLIETADRSLVPVETVVLLIDVVAQHESIRVIDAGRQTGLARSALKLLVETLSRYITKDRDTYRLSEHGKKFVSVLARYREARAAEVADAASRAIALLMRIESYRQRANRNFDQFPATPETSVRRALLMEQHLNLAGRRIVFMGDNDLTSIAIGLLGGATQLTVLDIDTRVLDLIKEVAAEEQLPIECHEYDARAPLDQGLRRSFDVVVTDPPYTRAGITLFLSRGAELLGNPNGSTYLSYGSSLRAREREVAVQQSIGDLGWLIYRLYPRFNEYFAAGSIGSRSNLYWLLATPQTRSSNRGRFVGDLYTGQTSARRNKKARTSRRTSSE